MAQQPYDLETAKFHATEASIVEDQTYIYDVGLALYRALYEHGSAGLAVGGLGTSISGDQYPSVELPAVPAGFHFERVPAPGAEPSYPDDTPPIDVRYLSPDSDASSCQARVVDPASTGGTDVEWSPTVKLWAEALNHPYGAFH